MKTRLYVIVLFVSFLLCTGCGKYLAVDPDNRATLKDQSSLADLLVSAYPQASYKLMAESMSDNFADRGMFHGSTQVNPVTRDVYLYKEIVQSREEDSPDFYWAACYKAIAAANQALDYIKKSGSPKEYLPYKGEALLCRAYAHFMLGVFFARSYSDGGDHPGIPYVKEVEDVVIKQYDRGTVKSMYANIIRDIEDGIPLLDDGVYHNEQVKKYHFNKLAAHTFASRVYLFIQDYDKVIEHVQAAFPDYTIEGYTRDMFRYASYPYLVLQQTYTSASEPANLLLATTPSNIEWYPYFRYGSSPDFATGFIKSNPPKKVNKGSLELEYSYAYNVYGSSYGAWNIPKFRAYDQRAGLTSGESKRYVVTPLITADEALFNWIEAVIMKGDYEKSLELIKIFLSKKLFDFDGLKTTPVRTTKESIKFNLSSLVDHFSTSDLKDTEACLLRAVLDFKRREYAYEGMRWMDMIRHRIPVRHNVVGESNELVIGPSDPRRILQLPIEVVMSGVAPNPR